MIVPNNNNYDCICNDNYEFCNNESNYEQIKSRKKEEKRPLKVAPRDGSKKIHTL